MDVGRGHRTEREETWRLAGTCRRGDYRIRYVQSLLDYKLPAYAKLGRLDQRACVQAEYLADNWRFVEPVLASMSLARRNRLTYAGAIHRRYVAIEMGAWEEPAPKRRYARLEELKEDSPELVMQIRAELMEEVRAEVKEEYKRRLAEFRGELGKLEEIFDEAPPEAPKVDLKALGLV